MKILVSNPSFQYSLNTVSALRLANYEVYFATSYWFNSSGLMEQVVKRLSRKAYLRLSSKTDSRILADNVIVVKAAFFYSVLCRLLCNGVEKRSFLEDRFHDKWVAEWVGKNKPNIVIGYEKSSLQTFKIAKKIGALCYLDLAQVHPNYILFLRSSYNFFRDITGSDILFEKISNIKQKEYQLADTIFCLSIFAQETLLKDGIERKKTVVNSLGLEPAIFFPKYFIESSRLSKIKFIYAGIITKRKGIEVLLQAFKDIDKSKAELVLVGPKGDASDLVRSHSNSNIQYIESVEQKELGNILRASDVFVFPSYLDSWAAVIPEAMACGLPVITTHSTGAAEIVSNEAGIVIDAGDLNALRTAITFFINNPQSTISMGKAAVEIAKRHTWKKYQDQLVAEIKSLSK